ncbi:hypothetical protein ACA910_015786 [Epithemia clementina (nom. ined.)]
MPDTKQQEQQQQQTQQQSHATKKEEEEEVEKGFHPSPLTLVIVTLLVVVVAAWLAPSSSSTKTSTSAGSADSFRIDPATNIRFATQQPFLRQAAGSKKLKLLGVGTRKKAILNVYSLGFYGNDRLVQEVERKVRANETTSRCQAILAATKGVKAARLQFNMGVGADKMAEAFTNIPDIPQTTKEEFADMILTGVGGDSGEEERLKKGDEMTVVWKAPDRVFVTARGKLIGQVQDKILYQGLLNVYLGPNSVSPSLKENIEKAIQ